MAITAPRTKSVVYDDLQLFPDTSNRRFELVEGVLLVSPAPTVEHQANVMNLSFALRAAAGEEHLVLAAPVDYLISDVTYFEPDIVVALDAEVGTERIERTPLLLVEVASPSTRLIDQGTKRLAYEAAGVPEYWLVDPGGPTLTVLRLVDGRYEDVAVVTGDDAYQATYPFPVTIVPGRLGRRRPPKA
ncbi:MAG: hypothetical protein QOE93_1750 [Actinomycetota bacterium]|jgi:Uma2 family endonuclease|nr:hypothetical protein [Actinomycetota bacterium]